MRRRALPFLLLLALLLGAGWALWGSRPGDVGGPAIERSDAVPDAPPPVVLGVPGEAEPEARLVGTGREGPADPAGPGGTLRCRVLGPDGAQRPRSLVQLELETLVELPAEAVPPPGFENAPVTRLLNFGHLFSDVHGVVAFSGLQPGRYRVVALAPPGLLAPEAYVDLGAADVDVDLSYRRTVSAHIEVLDPEGRPVPGAGITLERAHAKGVTTDEDGVATMEELDPRWDVGLRIRPPGNRDLFGRSLDPWTVGDTRVVLEASLSVSGSVVDETGEPVPKARVHRHVEGGSWQVWTTGIDGRFRFPGLRAGDTLTLRVGPPGSWSGAVTEAVVVEAGGDDHVVVLPRGAVLEVVVLDWPEDARGELRLTTTGKAPIHRSARIKKNGRCTFRYVDPRDVHVLWGVLPGDERFLYRAQVRAQDEPLEVKLQEGEPIHVRVLVPEGVTLRSVDASGPGVHRRAVLLLGEDGTYRIPPMPPGRWTVQALGLPSGPVLPIRRSWRAETVTQPGDPVELTLEPVD